MKGEKGPACIVERERERLALMGILGALAAREGVGGFSFNKEEKVVVAFKTRL